MRHQRESGRLSGLDGLRALAALGVLTFHADASLLPGGFLGVDLFFVISGYLITRLLLGEVCRTGRIRVAQFYLRRAIRLLPALLVLLVAVVAASALIWRDETATLADTVTASLGYYLNWWLIDARQSYFVASGRPPMLQHLWSLAIEEQFYLLWPAVLLLLNTRRRRFGRVAGVAITLALASTAAMAFLAIRQDVPFGADSGRVYFGSDTHAMGLLLGAAMGALAERLAAQPRRRWRFRCWPTDLAGLAALAGLGYVALTVTEFDPRLYRGGFLAVSALAAIAVSTATRPGSLLGRALDCRPLRWLGDRSYAMYLWHWPVVVVTRPGVDLPANRWLVDTVRLAAPIGLAVLSHAFVERPMRVRGTAWLVQRGRPGRSGARRFIPRLAGVTAVAAMLFALAVAPRGGSAPAAVLRPAVLRPAALAARVAESTSPTASASAAASATEVPKTAPAGSKAKQRKSPAPARPAPRSRGTITAFGDSVIR
ncbi:MAG TPA: acyltransferase family protein [Jatrophihabitans sp.]